MDYWIVNDRYNISQLPLALFDRIVTPIYAFRELSGDLSSPSDLNEFFSRYPEIEKLAVNEFIPTPLNEIKPKQVLSLIKEGKALLIKPNVSWHITNAFMVKDGKLLDNTYTFSDFYNKELLHTAFNSIIKRGGKVKNTFISGYLPEKPVGSPGNPIQDNLKKAKNNPAKMTNSDLLKNAKNKNQAKLIGKLSPTKFNDLGNENNTNTLFSDKKKDRKKNDNAIKLISETVVLQPKNRDRTKIGVGEEVIVKANIPVHWEVNPQENIKIKKITATQIHFKALDKDGNIGIRATQGSKEGNIQFDIVKPSGVEYDFVSDLHQKGYFSGGFAAKVLVTPDDVNFSGIEVTELGAPAVGQGAFAGLTGMNHCNVDGANRCGWHNVTYQKGKNTLITVDGENGSFMSLDHVYYQDYNKLNRKDLYHTDGEVYTDIDVAWRLAGDNSTSGNIFTTVRQGLQYDSSKDTLVSTKGNISRTIRNVKNAKNMGTDFLEEESALG